MHDAPCYNQPMTSTRPRWHYRLPCVTLAATTLLLCAGQSFALRADDLALVVNVNEPVGAELAAFYAKERGVPAGRIIALDLPAGEQVPFDVYNERVVPPVRKFLKDNALEKRVTCLVTFYGVPLRIDRRTSLPAENEEIRQIGGEFDKLLAKTRDSVRAAEAVAARVDPGYKPASRDDANGLSARAEAAIGAVLAGLASEADANARGQRFTELLGPIEVLYGSLETVERLGKQPYAGLAPLPLTPQQVADARQRFQAAARDLNALAPAANDAASREKVRQIIRDNFGAFRHLKLLDEQRVRLNPEETGAAFDSELSLLWWPDDYLRYRWQVSPLFYKVRFPGGHAGGATTRSALPQTLMVMRLDAPKADMVRDLITVGIGVEQEGMRGQVALDARGRAGNAGDAYGQYDRSIRDLAALIKGKTRLDVQFENTEAVFAPREKVPNVAVYCGWYSLRNYQPGMAFTPGAVGFHVASLELLSLHPPGERGWCRGLMNDGVVGTLGAVAEPYLHSFPAADDFFPLLLTGQLTLAEVYWLSNPLTSWMNACIGDPLYTPYKKNPALRVQDVPPRIHAIFEGPNSPASQPAQ